MLRRHPRRRRHRRQGLHALALAGHQQPQAIIPQRPRPVGMADHPDETLDICRKARFTAFRCEIHLSPATLMIS
jgi:hypothetical protein